MRLLLLCAACLVAGGCASIPGETTIFPGVVRHCVCVSTETGDVVPCPPCEPQPGVQDISPAS